MCEIVEEYANKKAEQAAKQAAELERKTIIQKMLKRGDSIEEILEIYSNLREQDILKIKSEM